MMNNYIGAQVTHYRKAKNLTMQDLAKAIGVTYQQVQKYEKGKNRISAETLQDIANYLHVPVHMFFPGGDVVATSETLLFAIKELRDAQKKYSEARKRTEPSNKEVVEKGKILDAVIVGLLKGRKK